MRFMIYDFLHEGIALNYYTNERKVTKDKLKSAAAYTALTVSITSVIGLHCCI